MKDEKDFYIEALQAKLACVTQTLASLVDDDNRPVEALARAAVELVADAQEELRKCQQDAIQLQARLAEAERAIENAGCCLVMSNNGPREALAILRGYKERATDSACLCLPFKVYPDCPVHGTAATVSGV